jgi:hypothetical protein
VEELMSVVRTSDVAGETRFIKERYEESERIEVHEYLWFVGD